MPLAGQPFFDPRGPQFYRGTTASDQIIADDLANTIYGRGGDDTIDGRGGDDVVYGREGADSLVGGDGDDTLYGSAVNDGNDGNDTLNGGNGNDLLNGGFGNDTLLGGIGNDRLFGGDGTDILNGGDGDDVLNGGLGDDNLAGGNGNDALLGGLGKDVLTGGIGADVFSFYGAADSGVGAGIRDVISDFNRSQGDKVQLLFTGNGSGTPNPDAVSFVNFGANGSLLRVDLDGDGSADFEVQISTARLTIADVIFS